MSKLSFILIPMLLLIFSCIEETDKFEGGKKKGLKPVYISNKKAKEITIGGAEPIIKPGKIYKKHPYIFINEKGKGIHIINNKDPRNPIKINFIKIPGNVDIAVKNNVMYADNFDDLVALNISDPAKVTVLSRVKKAIPTYTQMYPQEYRGYFECVDTKKGYVIEWVEAELNDPKCKR